MLRHHSGMLQQLRARRTPEHGDLRHPRCLAPQAPQAPRAARPARSGGPAPRARGGRSGGRATERNCLAPRGCSPCRCHSSGASAETSSAAPLPPRRRPGSRAPGAPSGRCRAEPAMPLAPASRHNSARTPHRRSMPLPLYEAWCTVPLQGNVRVAAAASAATSPQPARRSVTQGPPAQPHCSRPERCACPEASAPILSARPGRFSHSPDQRRRKLLQVPAERRRPAATGRVGKPSGCRGGQGPRKHRGGLRAGIERPARSRRGSARKARSRRARGGPGHLPVGWRSPPHSYRKRGHLAASTKAHTPHTAWRRHR
mmetsp:Transcript_80710/g.261607  ORF Transcript_80710/g.261607 Transcript_80710/m.261607 type:complete len:315 (+) Transcript_80710:1089-2033(+)